MTGRQKRHLRALAHPLKPIVNLGKQGLSRETKREIESQLLDHELIKCKVLDSCPLSKKECAEEISTMKEIEVVQIIGKTLILFSPHPEDPKIKFTCA
ncbi:MAG: ribosome assembly RNA-binding protein YhbY [SAR324 cluster bacterium]|jgi:RNA-binding protein|nr:ribosome assembly RNA-binding protein YhbY [SAR324 cluster bacterium]MEE2599933.1 ribosome assembly RNA-binding protein YhbY [SAR324 cluster bacterium]